MGVMVTVGTSCSSRFTESGRSGTYCSYDRWTGLLRTVRPVEVTIHRSDALTVKGGGRYQKTPRVLETGPT